MADEDLGITPFEDADLGIEPISPKESFLQKLGAQIKPALQSGAAAVQRGVERYVPEPIRNVTDFALGGLIREETAGKLAEKVGRTFPGSTSAQIIGAGIGTLGQIISPADLALPIISKLKLLAKAPQAVKAAEIAKIQAQVEPKIFKAATEALSPEELMAIAGAPEKVKAAVSFAPPPGWKSPTSIGNAPVPTTTGQPFTLQSGLAEQNRAALEAFRAKLPQGPAIPPRIAQEAALGPKPPIPPTPTILAPVKPVIKAGEGFAGNINLAKYPKPVADLLRTGNKEIGFAERSAQTIPEMKAIGSTPEAEQAFKAMMDAPPGAMPGVIQLHRETLEREATSLLGRTKEITEDTIKELTAIGQQGERVSRAAQMGGQTLRMFKEPATATQQATITALENLKTKILAEKSPFSNLAVTAINKIEKGINKKAWALTQTTKIFRSTMKAVDGLYYWFINSILSSPITDVRNIGGNVVFAASKPVEKAFSSAFDSALSKLPATKLTGQVPEHIFAEIPAQVKGAIEGLKAIGAKVLPDKYGGNWLAQKHEKLLFDVTQAGKRLDKPQLNPFGTGKVGKVIGSSLAKMEYEDGLAKLLIGHMENAGLRARGLTGEALKTGVMNEAAYRTFQQEAGDIVKAVMSARDKIPGARWIAPFIKTTSQLLSRGLERTPLGFAKVGGKLIKGSYTNQAELATELGQATMGTAAITPLAWLYATDRITGSYPQDKDERERWRAQGKTEFSYLSNGRYIPLSKLEPFGSIIKTAVAGIDAYRALKSSAKEGEAVKVALKFGKDLVGTSAFSGMNNFFIALADPERYGEKAVTGVVSGMVPQASKFAADLIDPNQRRKGTVVEQVQGKIPFLSKSLPVQTDILGNPIEGSVKESLLLGTSAKATPELDFADRLGVNLPDTRTITNPVAPLTTFENNQYRQMVGEAIKRGLQYEMRTPSFSDPEKERKFIENQISDIVAEKKAIINTRVELRNLGISLNPNPAQSSDIYTTVIRNKDYKSASKDQKKAMMNRFILFRQGGR